jgi:putative transposase
VWQRNYYEHVVRNERALQLIREYISNNPLRWDLDIENPANVQRGHDMAATAYYAAIWHEG